MKFLGFAPLKNLLRNRVRSLLTGLSIALAVFILCVIADHGQGDVFADPRQGGAETHVVVQDRDAFPSSLPARRYLDKGGRCRK